MPIGISAIGTAVPQYKRRQQELADVIAAGLHLETKERRLLKSLYKSTGIEYRHSVLQDFCKELGEFTFFPNDTATPFPSTDARMKIYKDNALTLALRAIDVCLENFPKAHITHLITVSCTGMYAPGLDIEIVQTLALNSSVKRTVINFMGCYGAFNALKIAHDICKADETANVLVVSVELCSIHFQKKTGMDHFVSNAIFADGAAAALVQAQHSKQKYLRFNGFHCDLLPQTSNEMAWHVTDTGFDIVLSSYVPQVIESGIKAFISRLLHMLHMDFAQIDLFAIHPGGLKILQACEAALNLREEQNRFAYQVLREYGNMSSATILFVLKVLWDSVEKKDHDKTIFSCAFGPGLTLESMLLQIA